MEAAPTVLNGGTSTPAAVAAPVIARSESTLTLEPESSTARDSKKRKRSSVSPAPSGPVNASIDPVALSTLQPRHIQTVVFSEFEIRCWYPSPYQLEDSTSKSSLSRSYSTSKFSDALPTSASGQAALKAAKAAKRLEGKLKRKSKSQQPTSPQPVTAPSELVVEAPTPTNTDSALTPLQTSESALTPLETADETRSASDHAPSIDEAEEAEAVELMLRLQGGMADEAQSVAGPSSQTLDYDTTMFESDTPDNSDTQPMDTDSQYPLSDVHTSDIDPDSSMQSINSSNTPIHLIAAAKRKLLFRGSGGRFTKKSDDAATLQLAKSRPVNLNSRPGRRQKISTADPVPLVKVPSFKPKTSGSAKATKEAFDPTAAQEDLALLAAASRARGSLVYHKTEKAKSTSLPPMSDPASASAPAAGPAPPTVDETTARNPGVANIVLKAEAAPPNADVTEKLYVCDGCFKYTTDANAYSAHRKNCKMTHPPGKKVYERGSHTIWQVDGEEQKLYCQNLCLFGKLFIDHKYVFFDTEGFQFYILTEAFPSFDHVIGFFSKEKVSYDDYNLACIVTFPPYQKKGYGTLLIEFSYELSRLINPALHSGTPERPLSDLGLRGYTAFWIGVLVRYFQQVFVHSGDPSQLLALPKVLTSPATNGKKPTKPLKGFAGEIRANEKKVPIKTSLDPTHISDKPLLYNADLIQICRATHLKLEDAIYALKEAGLMEKKEVETEEKDIKLVITPKMVDAVAQKWKVKPALLRPENVLL